MRKIETEHGMILMSEGSEIDPDSIFEPEVRPSNIDDLIKTTLEEIDKKELNLDQKRIKLIKDDKIFEGTQKTFILKETKEGKTVISVVFYLDT